MLTNFIDSLAIDKVQHHKNLEVLFLKSALASDIENMRTFDEMKAFVDIQEVSDDGEVAFLSFTNKSPYKLMVLSGSLISGNFQDRTVKSSFLLQPERETKISVYCVENLRWKDKISKGIKSKYHLSSDIRKNLRNSQQTEIWRLIKEKQDRMGIRSQSRTIHDIYESRKSEIEAFQEAFKCNADHLGIITLIRGKVISMDITGIKGLYPKLHSSIITSHIVDAVDRDFCKQVKNRNPLSVDAFLRSIKEAKQEYIHQDGSGEGISFETDKVVGDGLVEEDTILEMSAFAV
jgi:hypothetical protein